MGIYSPTTAFAGIRPPSTAGETSVIGIRPCRTAGTSTAEVASGAVPGIAGAFVAGAFVAGAFLAGAFLAGAFFADVLPAAAFFLVAALAPSAAEKTGTGGASRLAMTSG